MPAMTIIPFTALMPARMLVERLSSGTRYEMHHAQIETRSAEKVAASMTRRMPKSPPRPERRYRMNGRMRTNERKTITSIRFLGAE